ncbi:disulfide bond formation protein B [Stappia indica]|jgi:disulfide bond formation protein DsbB|uniref:Disulfide bond formation protein B n=1 Tax=Stappia indica TaxID=538381 RepID=A0A857C2S5_9HYPH|nr:disulfide bond formation protein B [Stappia indica]QGZ33263.1 disulfide bond formation protein B [Stappia indica]
MISRSFETTLNALALLAISAVLGVAFLDQFANGELPCPLCLLQRAGFLLLAVGPVLNVARGPRPAHYGVTILAGLLGAGFAMRQVLLHIEPGDAGYGAPFLGLHFYTWAFVVFVAAVAASALMLVLRAPIEEARPAGTRAVRLTGLSLVAVLLVLAMAALNTASTLIECGFESCPDNPTVYRLLQ